MNDIPLIYTVSSSSQTPKQADPIELIETLTDKLAVARRDYQFMYDLNCHYEARIRELEARLGEATPC